MAKKTETPAVPTKRAKKAAGVTPEQLAARLADFPDGANAVRLLVQAALSGRPDLLSAALLRTMQIALASKPKKQPKEKTAAQAAPAASLPTLTPAQMLAEEDKIKAADLLRNLTQPARPEEVLRDFVQAHLLPSYRNGQRSWSLKPTWKGRPLTSIQDTWVQALQGAGIDASRLLLQIVQGHLVVNLNGFNARMG